MVLGQCDDILMCNTAQQRFPRRSRVGVRPSRSRAACQVAAEDQSSRYVLANGIVDYYEGER